MMGTLNDTARQGMMASALGLTSEQFTGMAAVAKSVGEDTREFLESLVTMGKLGTDAANGIGEVAAPAFAALGIEAKKFISLRADEQFFAMFDALSKVQDPLTKTRLLMNAFGEDGGKWLLPLLSKAPDELRKMAGGFAISSSSMKTATDASAQFMLAEQALNSSFRELAIAGGPAMAEIASKITKTMNESKETIEAATKAGMKMIDDFLIPVTKLTIDAGAGMLKLATDFGTAAKQMDAAREKYDKEHGMGPKPTPIADAVGDYLMGPVNAAKAFGGMFPQTGAEWAKSLKTVGNSMVDALAAFDESVGLGTRPKGEQTGATDPFKKTNAILLGADEITRKQNEAAKAALEAGELQKKAAENQIKWQADKQRSFFMAGAGAFNDTPMAMWGKTAAGMMRSLAAGSGMATLSDYWTKRQGAGPWSGFMKPHEVPQFAGAVEKGSGEAYTAEMRAKYGDFKPKDNNEVTERLDRL
ncbi:MAG TPA: hypothetical protein VGL71_08950, partial [Urbifossiella sp.]